MKYLYLIIRHIFPRKRWIIEYKTEICREGRYIGYMFIYKDQFGNRKTKRFFIDKNSGD